MPNKKNKLIIGLVTLGILVFGVTLFFVIQSNGKVEQYKAEQLEATTHDINYVLPYKNEYMGNNSNTVNLFYHLPLTTSDMKFELFPDTLTVQIDYSNTLLHVGKESMSHKQYAASGLADELNTIYKNEVEKSIIYNSTAAFALIDNLEYIVYHFSDVSYKVSRTDIKALYSNFDTILNETNWKDNVQSKLKEKSYIADVASRVLIQQ